MNDYKTILKLHYEGVINRQIADRLKKSRNTISQTIKAAESVNLTSEQLDSLSEEELVKRLFPGKETLPVYAQPDFAYCQKNKCNNKIICC